MDIGVNNLTIRGLPGICPALGVEVSLLALIHSVEVYSDTLWWCWAGGCR